MSRASSKHFPVTSRSSAAPSLRRSGYKVPGFPALLGTDFSKMARADKVALLQAILHHKIHGISFSPYVDGQSPGTEISENHPRVAAACDMLLVTCYPFWESCPVEYFIRTYQWAHEEDIQIFYFSSFDEAWKVGDEGHVGACWGLWDKDGNLKYV